VDHLKPAASPQAKSLPVGSIITPLFISLLIIKTPAFSSTHDLGQAMAPKGNKEFKCIFPGCTSPGFGTLGAKQRHEREQHGGEQHGGEFKCDYCGYTAKRRYLIKDHMDIDHPDQKGDTPDTLSEQDILRY
jgi:hypothetical protein